MAEAASPSSHSSFCEEVFSICSRVPVGRVRHGAQRRGYSRMRWTGQIFWLLAFEEGESLCLSNQPSPCSRLHPRKFSGIGPMGSCIQLQQRNCSRVSRDFLRRSTFPSSQRTGPRSSSLRFERQDYLISELIESFLCPQLSLLQT
jgi:hypothetical protein